LEAVNKGKDIEIHVSTRQWAQNNGYDPQKLFQKLFHDDIKYLLSMENLWKKRRPPTPLDWNNLPDASNYKPKTEVKSPFSEISTSFVCFSQFPLPAAVQLLSNRLHSKTKWFGAWRIVRKYLSDVSLPS